VALAAKVNDQPVALADYESEVARYESAAKSLGQDLSAQPDYHDRILNALIDKVLILQDAQAQGISVSDADVQASYDQLVNQQGGQAEFDKWLQANLYTADQFKEELRAGLIANAVQSQVAASVPTTAEQVHAREILVATQADADKIVADLTAGADFATEAVNNSIDPSRINGGDLGWFTPTGLTQPEVAQAAFALQPNQISTPIKTALGFHIIQVLERDTRPLSATALADLQKQAVAAWLADLRSKAKIEKLVQ
jgi:parvulin-like peptidyl-prolyl isomerase